MSSNSGWLGSLPSAPKLSTVSTSPCPNRCSQTRLTITRAVSGLSLLAIQWASSSRPLWRGSIARCLRCLEHGQHAARNFRPLVLQLATNQHVAIGRRLGVAHSHRQIAGRRGLAFQFVELIFQLLDFFLDLLRIVDVRIRHGLRLPPFPLGPAWRLWFLPACFLMLLQSRRSGFRAGDLVLTRLLLAGPAAASAWGPPLAVCQRDQAVVAALLFVPGATPANVSVL